MNYDDMENLKNVYLEDSFLLGLKEESSSISFLVEAVLLKYHALYREPFEGEANCYKKCEIKFPGLQEVNWVSKNFDPIRGSDEEDDFGNIDSFTFSGSRYHISGEWGEVFIKSDEPILIWLD